MNLNNHYNVSTLRMRILSYLFTVLSSIPRTMSGTGTPYVFVERLKRNIPFLSFIFCYPHQDPGQRHMYIES